MKAKINSNNRETTSIRINPGLWKEAKLYALKNDMSIGEFVEKIIKKEMKKVLKRKLNIKIIKQMERKRAPLAQAEDLITTLQDFIQAECMRELIQA